MPSHDALIGMALVALGMVLIPGPNMMYLVSRSVSQGYRAGLVSLIGTCTGFVIYMVMANVGMAEVFLVVPWLYIGLKLCGAGYLLYLSWKTLRPGGVALFEERTLPRDSRMKLFRMGLMTNLLNPKAAIMYLALIPQFIRPDAGHVLLQGFVLGTVQISVSVVVNSVIICTAGALAVFMRRRPAWIKWQRWVTGGLLGAVGAKLALDAFTSATP
ncbi:MAG TPA: LysE family translocator [Acidimicrobiales bacterium]